MHSFKAVNNLLIVAELISKYWTALGEASAISDKAATALATTYINSFDCLITDRVKMIDEKYKTNYEGIDLMY